MLLLIKMMAVVLGIVFLVAGFILQSCAACKEVFREGKPAVWRFFGNAFEIVGVFGVAYVVFRL